MQSNSANRVTFYRGLSRMQSQSSGVGAPPVGCISRCTPERHTVASKLSTKTAPKRTAGGCPKSAENVRIRVPPGRRSDVRGQKRLIGARTQTFRLPDGRLSRIREQTCRFRRPDGPPSYARGRKSGNLSPDVQISGSRSSPGVRSRRKSCDSGSDVQSAVAGCSLDVYASAEIKHFSAQTDRFQPPGDQLVRRLAKIRQFWPGRTDFEPPMVACRTFEAKIGRFPLRRTDFGSPMVTRGMLESENHAVSAQTDGFRPPDDPLWYA